MPPDRAERQRSLPGRLTQTALVFVRTEASGGLLLFVAAVVALVWANSPFADSYTALWDSPISTPVGVGDLRHWINDGLMALFFLVVGLEIQRELTVGELSDGRRAALPVVAALGGMVVPALLYLGLNWGQPSARGWGIPMATDIAFAVGVLALLGSRIPHSLKVFLLSLAIADDIGAIAVIALFYTAKIRLVWLFVSVVIAGVVYLLRRRRTRSLFPYCVLGAALWIAVLYSGIHATIAGVVLGLIIPGDRRPGSAADEALADTPAEKLENGLHPWTSNLVIPLFALANAGVTLDPRSMGQALGSRIAWGILLGLVVGKLAGITLFSAAGVRFGGLRLPTGTTWRQMAGVAAIGGVGFTVSLFVAGLSFSQPDVQNTAKFGILGASLLAALLGIAILSSPIENREGRDPP